MKIWVNKRSDTEGFTAAHFAAISGNIEILEDLIKYEADINIVSKDGITLMHAAAQANQVTLMVS